MKLEGSLVLDDISLRELAAAVAPYVAPLLAKTSPNNQLLRLPAVSAMTGLKRSQIYRLMWQGKFPKPVKIGERSIAWPETEIRAWISKR